MHANSSSASNLSAASRRSTQPQPSRSLRALDSPKASRSRRKFLGFFPSNLRDLRPGDMVDLQRFIWVLGSDEYEEN
jgi:hypothetical protein